MIPRSNRPEVRNPVAADPEVAAIVAALPLEAAEALRAALQALAKLFRTKADNAFQKKKWILFSYWKCCGVYARHLELAMPRPATRGRK